MNRANQILTLILVTLLTACGGGGGGGSNDPTPAGGSGGGSGGGSVGGGSGGGTTTPPSSGSSQPGVELEGGVSGTGLTVGPIQGFSSVIVNGRAMDVTNAEIVVDGVSGTQAQLREGQGIVVIGDLEDEVATRVEYRPQIRGPVTEVVFLDPLLGTAAATVFGQAVRVNAATLYEATEFEALAAGNVLEVSGAIDGNGFIAASYVELENAASDYQVVGSVRNLTTTTFTIGALIVDYSTATLSNFNNSPIAQTDSVVVRGASTGFQSPDRFIATSVERIPNIQLSPEAELELEGFITSVTSASQFAVGGQPVVTDANTVFDLGDAEDLEVNEKVEVEGALQSDLSLLASAVTFRPLQAVRAEGPVEAVDVTASTVQVLGVTFSVRGTTELEDESSAEVDPFGLADLGVGDYVELRGFLEGATVVASELNRLDAEGEARLRGPVTSFDAVAGTLQLLSVGLSTGPGTSFENQNEEEQSAAEFFGVLENGLFVEAAWDNFADTAQPVDALEVEDDD